MMIWFMNSFASELLVTMVKVNPDPQPGEGTIWFDYFLATDPRIQPSSSDNSKNIGAIVGGVIGGVIFLIVIVALALVSLRRRKKRNRDLEHVQPWTNKEVPSVDSLRTSFLKPLFLQFKLKTLAASSIHPTVEPFRETNPAPASVTATHKPTLSNASSSTPSSSTTGPPSNVIISNPANRKRQGDLTVPASSSNALPESAIQHVDSGVRVGNVEPIQVSSARVELPPVYSPVWPTEGLFNKQLLLGGGSVSADCLLHRYIMMEIVNIRYLIFDVISPLFGDRLSSQHSDTSLLI